MKKIIIPIAAVVCAAIAAVIVIVMVNSAQSRRVVQEDTETVAESVESTPETTTAQATTEETTTEETTAPEDNIVNIAYLGIDKQENRSDVMMVLSINITKNKIKVISLLRDTKAYYRDMPVDTKLGYAYKWGGNELALEVINDNFKTDLEYYIDMWFKDVADIVDALGGVDIELTEAEAEEVNNLTSSKAKVTAGWGTLTGSQAVAYARIRRIDGEFYRSHRQHNVIRQLFEKLKAMPKSEYPAFITRLMGDMETNVTLEMLYSFTELDMETLTLDCYTIPDPDYETDVVGDWDPVDLSLLDEDDPWLDNPTWLWMYDLDAAAERLHSIIYEYD